MGCVKWFTGLGWRVTSPYGQRLHPIDKVLKLHKGIDFGGKPIGEPIYTPTGGEVIRAGYNGGFGNMVEILDKYGYKHLYAHMGTIAVDLNQRLERGDLIGLNGKTGKVTGPHVHYQISKNGNIFGDPAEFIYWEELDMNIYYEVVKGDVAWKIAQKHGLTLKELGRLNPHIPDLNKIYPGQTLLIKESPQEIDLADLLDRVKRLEDILNDIKNII